MVQALMGLLSLIPLVNRLLDWLRERKLKKAAEAEVSAAILSEEANANKIAAVEYAADTDRKQLVDGLRAGEF